MSEQLIAGISVEFFPANFVDLYNQTPEGAKKFLLDGSQDVIEAASQAQREVQQTQLALAKVQEEQQALSNRQNSLSEAYASGGLDLSKLSKKDVCLLEGTLEGKELREFNNELRQIAILKQGYTTQNVLEELSTASGRMEKKIDKNAKKQDLQLKMPFLQKEAKDLSMTKNWRGKLQEDAEAYKKWLQVLKLYVNYFVNGWPIPETLEEFSVWHQKHKLESESDSDSNDDTASFLKRRRFPNR